MDQSGSARHTASAGGMVSLTKKKPHSYICSESVGHSNAVFLCVLVQASHMTCLPAAAVTPRLSGSTC